MSSIVNSMLALVLEDKFRDQCVIVNNRYITKKVNRIYISDEGEIDVSGYFIDIEEPDNSFLLHRIRVEDKTSLSSGMPLEEIKPGMIEALAQTKIRERRRKADLLEEQSQDIVNLDYKEWFYKYR